MEEVRNYWQVASINHFCNLFRKPFKLPSFEPEELEQAFILDVPAPPKSHLLNLNLNNNHNNTSSNSNETIKPENSNNNFEGNPPSNNSNDGLSTNHTTTSLSTQNQDDHPSDQNEQQLVGLPNQNQETNHSTIKNDNNNLDEDQQSSSLTSPVPPSSIKSEYTPSIKFQLDSNNSDQNNQQQQDNKADDQPQHLLVKLAIALLKPHFNTKLTQANWENYLKRIIDSNWVDLEHHPSPFQIPILTQDGVELTKYLIFNELTLGDKIDVIYALCDYRLWCDDVAEAIKDYPIEELRLESIGKDSQGYEYWYFSGTRLYRENKELSQDLTSRKIRIKELEYELIELEKHRIVREHEEKKKEELRKSKQQAAEEKEAKLAAKRQQEQETQQNKRRKTATPCQPLRTGLRERRSSTTGNNNNSSQQRQTRQKQTQIEEEPTETRTTRSRVKSQQQQEQPKESAPNTPTPQPTITKTNSRSKNSKQNDKSAKSSTPELPKKSPEEECKTELDKLAICRDDRAEAWHIQCDSLEEWENFAVKFEKTKSTNEKYLSSNINEILLPKIRAIYAKRAAEVKRKEKELLLSLTYSSRRVSTRIISRQKQEEEEERQAQLREAEIRRKKTEAETRLRAELEREIRTRQNKFVINGGYSSACSEDGQIDPASNNGGSRYNLRQPVSLSNGNEFDGIIHPDNLSEFYEAIELVIDTVRTSKHAWPFVNPVPETEPGYYDLIKEPMDLYKIRTKIEFREYKSFIELEKDFQLLVNNCEQFNGPKNVYTKMVYKLWKSFRKNVRLYLERDLSMDEYETFLYPPVPKKEPTPPPPSPPEIKPTELDIQILSPRPINIEDEPELCHMKSEPITPTHPVQTITVSQQLSHEGNSTLKPELFSDTYHQKDNSMITEAEIDNRCIEAKSPRNIVTHDAEEPVRNNLSPAFRELRDEVAPEPVIELEI